MSKLPSKVYSPAAVASAPSVGLPSLSHPVVLTFNKVRDCDGEVKETTIFSDKILGAETCKVMYKGKAYEGVKIYTVAGAFKALTTVEAFANGAAHALHTGQAVKITAKAPLLLSKGSK